MNTVFARVIFPSLRYSVASCDDLKIYSAQSTHIKIPVTNALTIEIRLFSPDNSSKELQRLDLGKDVSEHTEETCEGP